MFMLMEAMEELGAFPGTVKITEQRFLMVALVEEEVTFGLGQVPAYKTFMNCEGLISGVTMGVQAEEPNPMAWMRGT
jgi:hypothetical protein